jgi:lysophospholipase L1-like esterase
MRNEEIDTNSIKILGFGDSVINGGVQTDHDSLATTILSDTLSKVYHNKIQFLNISSGSWGPDNCYAYLKKNGDFGAKLIFLFVSSHDAYDNMNFEKIVDNHVSFPSKQYAFALYELVDRYLLPGIKRKLQRSISETDNLGINKKTDKTPFNTGFSSFLAYSNNKNIPLTIYLHADQNELKSRTYNEHGQEIIKFANENNISIITDLQNGLELSDFRDGIHINCKGQRKLANAITNYIEKQTPAALYK